MSFVLGQKDAVVIAVKSACPNFVPYKDDALSMLSAAQLEQIKFQIGKDILAGNIAYSKSLTNIQEVGAYARSMVMNHLKKAKELNGNKTYGSANVSTAVATKTTVKTIKGLDTSVLPDDLKEFVLGLV